MSKAKEKAQEQVDVSTAGDGGKSVFTRGAEIMPICPHPSGFLSLGTRRVLGREGDVYYCPHCQERRVIALNGKVVASCAAGGEWREW